MTKGAIEALILSRKEAMSLRNFYIDPEHLMLCMSVKADNSAMRVMESFGLSNKEIEMAMRQFLSDKAFLNDSSNSVIPKPSVLTERILKRVAYEAEQTDCAAIHTAHILMAIIEELMSCNSNGRLAKDCVESENVAELHSPIITFFSKHSIDYIRVKDEVRRQIEPIDSMDDNEEDAPFSNRKNNFETTQGTSRNKNVMSDTPLLDNYGTDITRAAKDGKLDPVVGRDKEIERIAQILSRRKKNNPILIGEPGVGKSAIAEGLALRIVEKRVSRVLFDKRVVMLDVSSLVAGTKYRGQFEERIRTLLNEIKHHKEIILFIDEIHTIVGAGSTSGNALDAANMLKPALARGQVQCIGATTLNEYREYIEKDGAFERRFQKVMVEPTTTEETLQILKNIKDKYESHHNVTYTDEAIEACVMLTNRYISDRCLPDKAIDVLDEVGSKVHISNIVVPQQILEYEQELFLSNKNKSDAVKAQNYELAASFRDKEKAAELKLKKAKDEWQRELLTYRQTVDRDKVAEVVAMMSGVPVQSMTTDESQRLLKMRSELCSNVVGQNEAIDKVVKAILRNRVGLKDPNRPIGSFIFLGPTGVGKTHLAQKLAKQLFDSSDALIRMDMSEFMEKFSVSRLIGAPPGYVGYDQGGQLTEQVRRHPYSVVLFDEIEKAHPDVFNMLLQVLDEGHLTDSLGRKVDFKNTIIIMTSNVGSRELKDFGRGIGFSHRDDSVNDNRAIGILRKALNKTFAPEFINRIDDIVIFHELSKENIMNIIDIEMRGLLSRVRELGYSVDITEKAKVFLVEKSYDSEYGARPLRRSIQKYVEDVLAEKLLDASYTVGDTISIDYYDGEEGLSFCRQAEALLN